MNEAGPLHIEECSRCPPHAAVLQSAAGSAAMGRAHWKLTLALALFLVLNAFGLNTALWLASPDGYKDTVLHHSWDVLRGRGLDDSWSAMSIALEYAKQSHATPLYSEVFFKQHERFQYPPSALFALSGLFHLGGPDAVRINDKQIFGNWPSLNDLLGWGFLLATALATAALFEICLRRNEPHIGSGPWFLVRIALAVALTLTFYPVVKAYTLGQIQVWINGVFAISLLCWATGNRAVSGVLIGLMCLIKPHYALFLFWGVLRRHWSFAVACATTVGLGLAASISAFGWANHIDYLRVIAFLSEHGEAFHPNQSINGLMNRLMAVGEPSLYKVLEFGPFPPYNPTVYWITLGTSFVLLSAAFWPRNTVGGADRVHDFCIMAVSATLASPIAWEHHHGILLPVFAVLLPGVIRTRWGLVLIIASYVLASTYIPATKLLASTVLNVVQSYLLAASLIVLLLLYTAGRSARLRFGGHRSSLDANAVA